jgi:hypothetical protein
MEDDNDNVNDDEDTGSLDDDTDSNAEMTRTIEQMEESDILTCYCKYISNCI